MKIKVKTILPSVVFFYPSIYLLCCMLGIESILSRLMWLSSMAILALDTLKRKRDARQSRIILVYLLILALVKTILFGYA